MRPASDSARRARPLLGTFVEVTAAGAPRADLDAAIEEAFRAVADVHRLMSFHERESDVSRLNRAAMLHPVAVDPRTLDVLRWSQQFAERSRGCFDITVARELVDWSLLPPPESPYRPDPDGSWRDVEIRADGRVQFRRPVWIDLGGIAKGYAVDCAIERLRAKGITQGCVNAGGDLRVLGPDPEPVRLDPRTAFARQSPVLEIANASVASSGVRAVRSRRHRVLGSHLHGRRRCAVGGRIFASVVAGRCVVADALTKIVLALGGSCKALLKEHAATAYLHSPRGGWHIVGVRS